MLLSQFIIKFTKRMEIKRFLLVTTKSIKDELATIENVIAFESFPFEDKSFMTVG